MAAQKDSRTGRLREAIRRLTPEALEDGRADSGLTTLSFFSQKHPERHVWLDTDLGGALVIDLEDWTFEGTWDNAVAHLEATDEAAPNIVQAWLSGARLEVCIRLGGRPLPLL